MACDIYENACQESYPNNLFDNIVEINKTPYNIQQEGKCLIIVNNNRSRIDTPSPVSELAELAITSYLVCFTREGGIKQIHFLLAQCTTESCLILKNLGNIVKLPTDIQKKWFKFYLEELKLLKDRNVYEVVDLSKRQKAIKNCQVFNIKSDSYYRSQLVAKEFFQIKEIDFDELFSSVVCYKITCLFLAIGTLKDWDIYSVDIKTA